MKINRTAHLPWALFVLAASALAVLLYVARFYPQRVAAGFRFFGETPPGHATIGGTPLGLVFGTIAFGIFIFASLLGLRKKLPHFPLGHVQTWLRAHIWLTILTVPLVLLHSGFHWGSPMTTLLMGLYAVVMLSGFYGLFLQQKMPQWMKEQLPAEIVYEQIGNIRAQLCAKAKRLQNAYQLEPGGGATNRVGRRSWFAAAKPELAASEVLPGATAGGGLSGATPPSFATVIAAETEKTMNANPVNDPASEALLAEFIAGQLLPYLEARRGDKFRLGKTREAAEIFYYLKPRVAASYRAQVDEMERWSTERRLLDVQTRMQHWLHGWLFVHVPLSFLLLLLTAWHAFVTLFHY